MISFPNVAPKLKDLGDDEFEYYQQEAKEAITIDEQDRLRCVQNISAYTGLNFAQWNTDILETLLGDNRKAETHNLLSYYVEGMAGNYIANWFDPKFVANRDVDIEAVGELQRVYYILKDIFNYKASALSCIVNGLCYRGVEELVIDRSLDPRGFPRFVSRRPDMVIFDPNCYEDDISGTSKKAWTFAYMDLHEMVGLYKVKEGEIYDAAKKEEKKNKEKMATLGLSSFKGLPNKFGNKKQVVQHYHIEKERKTIEFDKLTLQTLPDTDDVSYKMDWAARNGVDLSTSMAQGMFVTAKVDVPVLYTTSWCPEYKVLLENRKDERQINGRLPLYDWSYISKHGKSIGLVDILWDAQENFNKLQVAKRKTLTQSHRGKAVIHDDAFMGSAKLRQQVIDDLSDETKPIILPPGSPPPSQVFHELRGAEPPQVLYQSEQMSLNLLQLLARMPPALQGRSEIQGESGIHFGRKVIEASILQRVPMEKLQQKEMDKADGWVIMAKSVFGGEANMNREFIAKDAGVRAMLNIDRGYDPETGSRIIEKDISSVDRINVTIVASKENDFLRQAKREMDAVILQAMVPDQTNLAVRAVYEDDLVLNSDFTDLGQKERAEKAVKQRAELLDLQMNTAIAQARAQMMMAQQMAGGGQPSPQMQQGAAIDPNKIQTPEQVQPERPSVPRVKSIAGRQ